MLIDWFTVAAQALNFLILAWLLKRFAYGPILNAITEREKRIAAQLADAASKEVAATQERETFKHKNEELEQQRAALLAKVDAEGKTERLRLLEEARQEVATLRTRLQEALRKEQQDLRGEITLRVHEEVFSIARKTLADLASLSLDETMVRVFVERLRALPDSDRKLLQAAMAEPGAAVVRGAFDLSPEARTLIEAAIAQLCGTVVKPRYEIVPQLISGVEVSAGGRKLAWSVADYLLALESRSAPAEAAT